MPEGRLRRALLAWIAPLVLMAACGRAGLAPQYEYEEQIYLDLDGSATVVVNASIHALVALRGLPLDPSTSVRFDRNDLRQLYASPVARVQRVSPPWRRAGRRFVQVRLEVEDVRRLPEIAPLAWSTVRLEPRGQQIVYTQRIGPPDGKASPAPPWTGGERVLFRLHLPSRITYHNAPSRQVERGNILSWEQPLADRLRGVPIDIEVHLDRESIFRRTMVIFGAAVSAALLLLVALVWWVRRKGQAASTT